MKKAKNSNFKNTIPDNTHYVKELEKQVTELSKSNENLILDNIRLRATLKDNGLTEEDIHISDAEAICMQQIERLKEMSASRPFSETDAKIFDILHRNLRLARGNVVEKDNRRKTKALTVKELNDILKKN